MGNQPLQGCAEFNDELWPIVILFTGPGRVFSAGQSPQYRSNWQGGWKPRSWFWEATGSSCGLGEFLCFTLILQGGGQVKSFTLWLESWHSLEVQVFGRWGGQATVVPLGLCPRAKSLKLLTKNCPGNQSRIEVLFLPVNHWVTLGNFLLHTVSPNVPWECPPILRTAVLKPFGLRVPLCSNNYWGLHRTFGYEGSIYWYF